MPRSRACACGAAPPPSLRDAGRDDAASGGASAGTLDESMDAYTGEHGVYGLVLVTALVAIGEEYDNDLEVLVFVVGTDPRVLARARLRRHRRRRARHVPSWAGRRSCGAPRHAATSLVGDARSRCSRRRSCWRMGVLGLVDEDEAYDFALIIGLLVLGADRMGATRDANGRRWPMQIVGALSTTMLGALVILLSILVH